MFSFWKALQYQFLIDTYEKEVIAHAISQEIETLRTPPSLHFLFIVENCHRNRLLFLREAYILSLERTLCLELTSQSASPSPPSPPSPTSQSLFLQFSSWETFEAYEETLRNKINFREAYLSALESCLTHDIYDETAAFQAVDETLRLESMNSFPLLLDIINKTAHQRLFSLSTRLSLVLAHASFSFHDFPVLIRRIHYA